MLLAVGLSIVMMEWLYIRNRGYSFAQGLPSPQTYRVISPVKYEDHSATGALREMVEERVAGVVVRDVAARDRMKKRLEELQVVKDPRDPKLLSYMPPALLNALFALDGAERSRIIKLASQVGDAYFSGLASGDVLESGGMEVALLWEEIGKRVDSVDDANLIYQILTKVNDAYYKLEPQLTELVRQSAEKRIPVIERRLELGDVIVERGDMVTPQTAGLLRLQGYTEDAFPVTQVVIVFFLVLILPLWLEVPARESGSRPPWECVVFVVSAAWIGQMLAVQMRTAGAGILPAVMAAYLSMPRSFAFNASLASTASGVFIIAGLSVYDLLLLLSMGFLASMTGYYLLRRIESRESLVRRLVLFALFLSVSRIVILWIQGVPLTGGFFWIETGRFLLLDALAAIFMVVLLPLVEGYIGVLSILRLRELSHPSSPLLRKLQRDAPGTYQHCLSIATLAEAVAIDMGMDENLMKAGAYYHDIGKLRRPQFFVENQGGGPNVHDGMSPTLSAMTIISHVQDGLEMAREYGLPRRIRDFIAEHHGTACVRYFYNKARAEAREWGEEERVAWSDFCYPGPKPRSRETALLMILDSLEAAIRSESLGRELLRRDAKEMPQSGRNAGRSQAIMALKKVIDQVVGSKIAEGQFDEVDFTLRDLTRIKESLLSVLLSMYHTRMVRSPDRGRQREAGGAPAPAAGDGAGAPAAPVGAETAGAETR
ncbi:HDIG domain-containing metalloprotein [uncultured Fretibacterium sp.]|uniref:HDIG domain-containing metalloprotein n=1 Tax=uncultured Fretibacterium sp. TaxID=1678694 RepID=UPI0026322BCC|nr:HDIG domain-containing metalloprotein [uncultured Fretibacterium sp.]